MAAPSISVDALICRYAKYNEDLKVALKDLGHSSSSENKNNANILVQREETGNGNTEIRAHGIIDCAQHSEQPRNKEGIESPILPKSLFSNGNETPNAVLGRAVPDKKGTAKYGNLYNGTTHRRGNRKGLATLAVITALGVPLTATALTLSGQELRIGSGVTAVTSAVSLIPLRRDERVGLPTLIPMYLISLVTTASFLALQCRNITHYQGRYVFGTLVLTGHFVVGLSNTSNTALDGIIDFGPVILPMVAAAFSLMFRRRQPVVLPGANHDAMSSGLRDLGGFDECDIGMVTLPVHGSV